MVVQLLLCVSARSHTVSIHFENSCSLTYSARICSNNARKELGLDVALAPSIQRFIAVSLSLCKKILVFLDCDSFSTYSCSVIVPFKLTDPIC